MIFVCDGQPAAQISKWIAANNRRFYLGDSDAELPDLFADDCNKPNDEEFEKLFAENNVKFGFTGKGKGSNTSPCFHGKFMALPGAFHAGMKLHNSHGLMFENLNCCFFKAW